MRWSGVTSGPRGSNFNRPAARWAAAHGKPVVGNSDLHDLRQLGRTFSFVIAERNPCGLRGDSRRPRLVSDVSGPEAELAHVLTGMFRRVQ